MVQAQLSCQSLLRFQESFIPLRTPSMPLEVLATAAQLLNKPRHEILSISIPAIRTACQCIDQCLLRLLFGLSILSVGTFLSAGEDSCYQRVCKLEVFIVVEDKSNDHPYQAYVTTDLADHIIKRLDSPRNNLCLPGLRVIVKERLILDMVSSLNLAWLVYCVLLTSV